MKYNWIFWEKVTWHFGRSISKNPSSPCVAKYIQSQLNVFFCLSYPKVKRLAAKRNLRLEFSSNFKYIFWWQNHEPEDKKLRSSVLKQKMQYTLNRMTTLSMNETKSQSYTRNIVSKHENKEQFATSIDHSTSCGLILNNKSLRNSKLFKRLNFCS